MPATPATVSVYLAALAGEGKRPSTIARALAGIADEHRHQGCAWVRGPSVIGEVMRGIRRRHGMAPAQKAPLSDDDMDAMVAAPGDDLVGLRDRALLTMGWMGAFRRSELVALMVEDVGPQAKGSWCGYAARRATKRAAGRRRGSLTPRARVSARCAPSRRGSRLRASHRARSSARWGQTGACVRTLSAAAASRASCRRWRQRRVRPSNVVRTRRRRSQTTPGSTSRVLSELSRPGRRMS